MIYIRGSKNWGSTFDGLLYTGLHGILWVHEGEPGFWKLDYGTCIWTSVGMKPLMPQVGMLRNTGVVYTTSYKGLQVVTQSSRSVFLLVAAPKCDAFIAQPLRYSETLI